MALAAVCGGILLSIIVPAWWLAEQWIEQQGYHLLDRMVWHGPLEEWNE
jgi:hypothetical protein